MLKLNTDIVLYDDSNELEFATNHPYWLAINGYFIKLSKTNYTELSSMLNPKPTLTDTEKMILSVLDPTYTWIARDPNGELWIFKEEPLFDVEKNWFINYNREDQTRLQAFEEQLFKSIKPYNKYLINAIRT